MSLPGRWLLATGTGVVLLATLSVPAPPSGAAVVTRVAAVTPTGAWPTYNAGPRHAAARAADHLAYYGGPVLSHMASVDVSYGAGSYISPGHPGASAVPAFTAQFLGSGVNDWLSEYDTPASGGTGQTIGRGTFAGSVTITPSAADDGSVIQDSQIQAELDAQITAGALPAPVGDTSYALFIPLGKQICNGSSCSLVAGGFCAYHNTYLRGGVPVTYQVLPDLTGTVGCGAGTDLDNTTSVLSHELTETITDPDIGLVATVPQTLGWYDVTHGEIGDICNARQTSFIGTDQVRYVLQEEFSDVHNTCYAGVVPVQILTTSLPPGAVGTAYAQTLTASLGNPPYTWKLVVGSGSLPKGVKLGRTTGALTGTPRASGTFSFAVEVLDARSASKVHTQTVATQALSLTVT